MLGTQQGAQSMLLNADSAVSEWEYWTRTHTSCPVVSPEQAPMSGPWGNAGRGDYQARDWGAHGWQSQTRALNQCSYTPNQNKHYSI